MIIVYSPIISERLKYSCEFILKEQLGLNYLISNSIEECSQSERFIINYSSLPLNSNSFQIIPHNLLFEIDIKKQAIDIFEENNYFAFFKNNQGDFSFDLFSAAFFLLSRYEEYWPHQKDSFGRFAHQNSIAFQFNFLKKPVVNYWIESFAHALKVKFEHINFEKQSFKQLITFDIDFAWAYLHKGIIRNVGGWFKNPNLERIKVLLGFKKDPFEIYDWLDQIHKNQELIYFFPMTEKISEFDKNINPQKKALQLLVKDTFKKHTIGLHPSWKSYHNERLLRKEKSTLEHIVEEKIAISRQHFIKFLLPETFSQLINAGITKEFSMGYGTVNGFRASVASSFLWYDLKNEKTTTLRLFPFCFMDANCYYEQQQSAEVAFEELLYYKKEVEKINGLFIPIFHNNFLSVSSVFNGWREKYEQFILHH